MGAERSGRGYGRAMTIAAELIRELRADPALLAELRRALDGDPAPPPEPVVLLSAEKAAERFGCHYKTLQRWCCEGRVPGAFKAGRNWMVPGDAIVDPKPRSPGRGRRRKSRIPAHDQAGQRAVEELRAMARRPRK